MNEYVIISCACYCIIMTYYDEIVIHDFVFDNRLSLNTFVFNYMLNVRKEGMKKEEKKKAFHSFDCLYRFDQTNHNRKLSKKKKQSDEFNSECRLSIT
jgi:hypothetical protein